MLRPILFNNEMVQAILEGRKTATRRIVKPNTSWGLELLGGKDTRLTSDDVELICDPPCAVGDVLWVRETWDFLPCIVCRPNSECCEIYPDPPDQMETADGLADGCFLYKADCDSPLAWEEDGHKWRPSIHMPKQAARIFLRVTEVFPERLRESFDEASLPMRELAAEGILIYEDCKRCLQRDRRDGACLICGKSDQPRWEFSRLWDSTIRKDRLAAEGWAADPWVWVIRFERVSRLAALEADPSLCVE